MSMNWLLPGSDDHQRFMRYLSEVVARYRTLTRLHVVRPMTSLGGISDGEPAYRYLSGIRDMVRDDLIRQAAIFTPARWLWYLRRLPDSIFRDPGDVVDDGGTHRRHLAETVSAMGGSGGSVTPEGLVYPVNERVVNIVVTFVAGVHYLASVDWRTRAAARGVAMKFGRRSEFPEPAETPQQKEAYSKYAERLFDGPGRFLLRAGFPVGSLSSVPDDRFCVLSVAHTDARLQVVKGGDSTSQPPKDISILQRYVPTCLDLASLAALVSPLHERRPAGWPSGQFCSIVHLLRLLLDAVQYRQSLWNSLMAFGYLSVDADIFEDFPQDRFRALTLDLVPLCGHHNMAADIPGLLHDVEQIKGTLSPLRPGSILRQDGNLLLIDVVAASGALDTFLDFPSVQGEEANWRSSQFEFAIRAIIEQSDWAPPPALKELNGRHLRLNGVRVTDVDGIAAKGDQLLLISAKSRVFTPDLDKGEFASVRNAAILVEDACKAAEQVMQRLKNNPRGDNFDFSQYSTIWMTVCTPYPIFVPIGIATQSIENGPPRVMSFDELDQYIRGKTRLS